MMSKTLKVKSLIKILGKSQFCTSGHRVGFDRRSTIDPEEISRFSQLCRYWWDLNGPIKGLHAFTPLRVEMVRTGLATTGFKEKNPGLPLDGVKLLDVGCGGGILTEALARAGARATGLDASEMLVSVAKEHATSDQTLASRLDYVHSSIEDFSGEKKGQYDAVVASEIIEHVSDPDLFIRSCVDVLKPNGSIFVTTINRNVMSWLVAILLSEHILGLIPKGTHEWKKFISPRETENLLKKYNCKTVRVQGALYNPLTVRCFWIPTTCVFYALHAVKRD